MKYHTVSGEETLSLCDESELRSYEDRGCVCSPRSLNSGDKGRTVGTYQQSNDYSTQWLYTSLKHYALATP